MSRGPGAVHSSDVPPGPALRGRKRVVPDESRAPQRPRSATRRLGVPARSWRFCLRDKSPELLWDNEAAAAGNRAAWALWGTSEGSLSANGLCAYGTVSNTYVS